MRRARHSFSASFLVKTVMVSPGRTLTFPLGMISSPPALRMAMKTKSFTLRSLISWSTMGAPSSATTSKMVPPGMVASCWSWGFSAQ